MRRKQNLIPRMQGCASVLVTEPEKKRGLWALELENTLKVSLEIGCGKGLFTAKTALNYPNELIIAIEKVADAMVVAMERVCSLGLKNVRFIYADAGRIPEIFASGEIDLIYINFCDPWPKKRDAKRRLTSPGLLALYTHTLKPGGEIHLKTDNSELFRYSTQTLGESGFYLSDITTDLHADGTVGIMTDYEIKFHSQGMKINRLVARLPERAEKI